MSAVLEAKMLGTPLPLPVHFPHAQRSFSLKKRRLPFSPSSSSSSRSPPRPLSWSLPPRPPSKGCLPVSRMFPQRHAAWTPLSRDLMEKPPPRSLYDPQQPRSFFVQCFINLGQIGRGSFGDVYKVRSLLDGRLYAVKRSAQRFRGKAEREQRIREARNHERLQPHPHILGFSAAWEEGGRLYIQTELCSTSLLLHAEAQPTNTGELCAWDYLCDLLSALCHIHSQGFAHLDLKPANVLITRSGRLKMGDFGLMLRLPNGRAEEDGGTKREKEDVQEGDPCYMAPELLRGEYGAAADIFSLGVSILELACNIDVPKGGDGWQQLRQGHLPSEFTNALSPELQRVLRLMLAPEPRDRATAQQLLALPSVRKHLWRRQLSLRLHEAWMSVLTLGQSLLSAGWGFLRSLNVPFAPRCPLPVPCTPPRESWERDGDASVLQHSSLLSDSDSPTDQPVFLTEKLSLEDSPTFSQRILPRLAFGSTSTPLPDSGALPQALPHTPSRSLHSDSLTHTPRSSHSDAFTHTLTASPGASPIRSRLDFDHHDFSDSPSSVRSHCSGRWVNAEPGPRAAIEPKNLLSLFDESDA